MYIARDEDNTLALYCNKPVRIYDDVPCPYKYWLDENDSANKLYIRDNGLFPELKWEDEPIEVQIVSKKQLQEFGDRCYVRGYNDANRFEYGEAEDGNITFESFLNSK